MSIVDVLLVLAVGLGSIAIIVLVNTVAASRRSGAGEARPAPPIGAAEALRTPLDPELRDRLLQLTARGKKIQAIKELRDATGHSLQAAKQVVDALASGGRPGSTADLAPAAPTASVGFSTTTSPAPNQAPAPTSARDLADRVRTLRSENGETYAIRLVCDETGMGISEAQSFVRSVSP